MADLDGVADLERLSFPIPWKRDFFASEIGPSNRFNRVLLDGRARLAAYVFCAHGGGEVHVNKIAVAPVWRRKGLAEILMREVLRMSIAIRAEEIYLEVRPSNIAARRFYEKIGFKVVGRRPAYYADAEDAIVMARRVPPGERLDGGTRELGDSRR